MTRRVLLDTNLLVAALDQGASTSPDQREKAIAALMSLLQSDDVALAITPLIRYEVVRGVDWASQERHDALKEALADFEEFDISRDIAELAADLYRFDKSRADEAGERRNLEKRKFDAFHLASAKCYELELASQDTDIAKLDKLYQTYRLIKS